MVLFLSDHHTKKFEKPFSSSPGRNSSSQQSLLLMCKDEPDVAYAETNYQSEPAVYSPDVAYAETNCQSEPAVYSPDVAYSETNYQTEPAVNSAGSVGKERKATQGAQNPSDNNTCPKRYHLMKNPLKSDTCFEIDEFKNVEELNSNVKDEPSDNVTETVTELNSENTPAKSTYIVPVSGPIESKLDTENPSDISLI